MAEALLLAKDKKYGLYEGPEEGDGNEQQPEKRDAALEVNRHGSSVASGKGLRPHSVEGGSTTKCIAPSLNRASVTISTHKMHRDLPVTIANIMEKAAADSSSGPNRPLTRTETV